MNDTPSLERAYRLRCFNPLKVQVESAEMRVPEVYCLREGDRIEL